MLKISILVLFLVMVIESYGQESWKKEGVKLPPTVCYASTDSTQSFVKPPVEYLQRLKSGSAKQSSIEVSYVGFSVEAQQAFQYAVDIWQKLVYSPIPIRMQANWKSLSTGVLGSCGPADYYHNFNSTQIWDCYYPVALVEKMLGEEVNAPTDFDIIASFNKDFSNWYFGTDGKTPAKKYDFVSTVLHELAHGLGFSGFFYSVNGSGGYGSDGLSAVFDQFVNNKIGDQLVNTKIFQNPSVKLHTNLTSGWLEFATQQVNGYLPRLFAPSIWDDGSSIYHLDENIYSLGDYNSLMTPYTGSGEAIHDPGPNTLAIMYDMGWKCISIKHKQKKDIEFLTAPIDFNVQIDSDYDLDSTKLFLIYSSNKFIKIDSVLLKPTSNISIFNAQLPKTLKGDIQYYITASDVMNRKYVFPSGYPSRYLSFKIGIDKDPPIVYYDPIKYMLTTDTSKKIVATITDNIGIKSVELEYFVTSGISKKQYLPLQKDSDDVYSALLYFQPGEVKDGDQISYRIVAVDASSQSNIGSLPASGYDTFYIEGFKEPVDHFIDNFDVGALNYISSDFTVSSVSGFDSPALNSPHPYPSPDSDNNEYNFTAILKYPIILKEGGKMSFDEIVLVEPGDVGIVYGDQDFWDYVIVEGSNDNGDTWKPLIDGYDSNAQKSWSNLFNSAMSSQNSTAVPTKDLFVKREIDLLANGNFVAGDVIQIRFRLFSDPYAHGWGWIIDNLSIQDFGTAIDPFHISSGEISFYPNPAKDQLTLQIQTDKNISKFFLKAYNFSGQQVYSREFPMGSGEFQTTIDVSNFVPGLYLFALEPEKGPAISRKILIQ